MTILSAIQNVSSCISITTPATVFSSTEREHFELQVLANESASHIAKDYEWQMLKVLATLAGDGTIQAFDLPGDYDRMLKESALWSNRVQAPLTHVTSTDRWLELDIRQFSFVTGAWTILGNRINIKPAPANGETIKFYYMSNKWAMDENGAPKGSFATDTDSFRLSEQLLALCMIWKWKSKKKLPFAQERDDYEDLKEKLIAADKGSRIFRVGRVRLPRDVEIAYPIPVTP